MTGPDHEALEILILGELTLRRGDAVLPAPTGKPAAILTALALGGDAVPVHRLQYVIADSQTPTPSAVRHHLRTLHRDYGVPYLTGPRGTGVYGLDRARCRVDAKQFVDGVDAEEPIDDLLRLWHGPVDEDAFRSDPWKEVRAARTRLIQRIVQLPETERSTLTGLARFTEMFPDDPEVHPIRPFGPGARPMLLVVEDHPDVMREICGQWSAYYRFLPIATIEEWHDLLLKRPELLADVKGALVDLHLKESMDDRRGLQVVRYLRDKTDILAALVTANAMESSDYKNNERKAEFRLVAIVSKREPDWWEALEIAVRLLVGDGDAERRHRLETRLETAYRFVRREHQNDPPGSVGASRLEQCRRDYATAIGQVRAGQLDDATAEVDRFCGVWWRPSG